MQPPVELDSIESDALVAKGKFFLCLTSIVNNAGGPIKARLIAMGNVLFDKHVCSTRRCAARPIVSGRVNGTHRTRESGSRFLSRVMPPEVRAMFDKLRRPLRECMGAVYGFARSGRDFIMSFAGWLIMNRWLTVTEAPALHVLWHDGDGAGATKRPIKAREYVVRGASWTNRACEGGGDTLSRTVA